MKRSQPILFALAILGFPVGLAPAQDATPRGATAPSVLPPAATTAAPAVVTHAPAICDIGCPAAEQCDPKSGGLIAGVGLYLLQPYFENNPAFLAIDTRGATRIGTHADVVHHMEAAPLMWLGYVGECGLGVRARYWYFREGTNLTLMDPPARAETASPLGLNLIVLPGRPLNVTTKFEMQSADIEALQNLHTGCWDFVLTGGIRLARIAQSYNAFIDRGPGSVATLLSNHSFNGVGPTLAAEVHRPLGQTNIGLYGNGRASILFGSASQTASIEEDRAFGIDHRNRSMLVGELEVGVEYRRAMCRSAVFGQIGLVGQDWFGAGSASRASNQVITGGDLNTASNTIDSDIALFGLVCRIGLNY